MKDHAHRSRKEVPPVPSPARTPPPQEEDGAAERLSQAEHDDMASISEMLYGGRD